jgi:titin
MKPLHPRPASRVSSRRQRRRRPRVNASLSLCLDELESRHLLAVLTPPAAPTALRVQEIAGDATRVNVGWTAPTSFGGDTGIRGYELQVASDPGFTTIGQRVRPDPTATNTSVSGLAAGVPYYLRLYANNLTQYSQPSSTAIRYGTPGSPSTFAVQEIPGDDTRVNVSWKAPSSFGGDDRVRGYELQVSTAAGFTTIAQRVRPDPTATTGTVTGLSAGVPYFFRLYASNLTQYSLPSNAAVRYVNPAAPTFLSVQDVPGDATRVNAIWNAPTSFGGDERLRGYQLQVSTDGGFTSIAQTVRPDPAGTSSTVTGLTPGIPYFFRLYASTLTKGSLPSNTAVRYVSPAAPTGLAVQEVAGDETRVNLNWKAPASFGGDDRVRGYELQVSTTPAFSTIAQRLRPNATGTTATVTGLTPGVPYFFRLYANNLTQGSLPSNTNARYITPQAPTGLSVQEVAGDATRVNVAWNAPTSFGGDEKVRAYQLQVSPDSGFTTIAQTVRPDPTGTAATVTGLTAGIPYFFRLYAVNLTKSSLPSNTAIRYTNPPAPTGLSVQEVAGDATRVNVSWKAPTSFGGDDRVRGYELQVSTDSGFTTIAQRVRPDSASTTATVSGLAAGVPSFFRLYANTLMKGSLPSNTAVRYVNPAAPSGLAVQEVAGDATRVNLSWAAPASLGGDDRVRGYQLQVAADASFTTIAQTVRPDPAATAATVTGLAGGIPYFFRIYASTLTKGSLPSNTAVRYISPVASSGLSVQDIAGDPTRVNLSWNAPTSFGGDDRLRGYDLQVSTDPGFTTIVQTVRPDPAVRAATVAGLTAGIPYYFRLWAYNLAKYSLPSNTAIRYTAPAAPSNLAVQEPAGDATRATVSWTTPAAFGGDSRVRGYELQVSNDPGFTVIVQRVRPDPASTAVVVSGLNAAAPAFFRLYALNFTQSSLPSNVAIRYTSPAAPTGLAVQEIPGDETQVNLTWAAPTSFGGDDRIRKYQIDVATDPAFTNVAQVLQPAADARAIAVAGLTTGVPYYFRIWALNQTKYSLRSNTAVRFVNPASPTGLIVLGVAGDATRVNLQWTPPTSYGGDERIRGYFLEVATDAGFSSVVQTARPDPAAAAATVSGLSAGIPYYFRLWANNLTRYSTPSNVATWTTLPHNRPGTPPAPTVARDQSQATVSWSTPSTDGGSPILGYSLQWSTDSQFGTFNSKTVNTLSTTVTSLQSGTTYFFRVAAYNANGQGNYSVATQSGQNPTSGVPGTPMEPGVARQQTQATVSWSAPANNGSPIQGYTLQWSTDSQFGTFDSATVASTSTTVTQLLAGITYYFRVAAYNANGQGNFSAATRSDAVKANWWEKTWKFELNMVDELNIYSGSASLTLSKISDDGTTTRIQVSVMAIRDTRPTSRVDLSGRLEMPISVGGSGTWVIEKGSRSLDEPDAFVSDYLRNSNFVENGDYLGDPARPYSDGTVFFFIYRDGRRGSFGPYLPIKGVPWTSASSP